MCNHEFLQRIFTILASSAIVFFCNSDSFCNFPFSINQSFCNILSVGLLPHHRFHAASLLIVIGLNKHLLPHIIFPKLFMCHLFLVHHFPIVDLRSDVDCGSRVFQICLNNFHNFRFLLSAFRFLLSAFRWRAPVA